jgi:stalled ribosome rescue protein Dom34
MSAHHAVVWIDHSEARIFRFVGEDKIEKLDLHGTTHGHIHNKHNVSGRREEDHHYLRAIIDAVKDAEEFLVVGPGTAKLELVKQVHKDHKELDPRLIGVETVDHPTDGQLLAFARKYFRRVDALR